MNSFDEIWKLRIKTYKRFLKEYCRFPQANDKYEGINVGQWLKNQRTLYIKGKLPEDRTKDLDVINPAWRQGREQIKTAEMQMLIASNWRKNVPKGDTLISAYYKKDKDIYECLKRGVFSCEQLIASEKNSWVLSCLTRYDVYECYEAILPNIDGNYLKLLCDIFRRPIYLSHDAAEMKEFVNEFPFISKKDMIERIDSALDQLNDESRYIIRERYALDGTSAKTLDYIGKRYNITRECVRQKEAKAIKSLRAIADTFIGSTKTEANVLNISNYAKSFLHRNGVETVKEYITLLNDEERMASLKANHPKVYEEIEKEKEQYIADIKGRINRGFLYSDNISLFASNHSPIDVLNLSARSYNCLYKHGIKTLADLKKFIIGKNVKAALLEIPALGNKSADEIIAKIKKEKLWQPIKTPIRHFGYRTETFIGSGIRDAREVLMHELFVEKNLCVFATLKRSKILSKEKNSELIQKLHSLCHKLITYKNPHFAAAYKEAVVDEILLAIKRNTGYDVKYLLWLADIESVTDTALYGRYLSDNYADLYLTSPIVLAEATRYGTLYGYENLPVKKEHTKR